MRLLNKNTARRAAAAAALLTMTAAMSVGAFAADAEDATVAGYLPPQSSEVMVQGDIALHSDVPVGEVDPNYGGYASPVENPIQGNVMMISDETPQRHLPHHHPRHADPDESGRKHSGAQDRQDFHHPEPDSAVPGPEARHPGHSAPPRQQRSPHRGLPRPPRPHRWPISFSLSPLCFP